MLSCILIVVIQNVSTILTLELGEKIDLARSLKSRTRSLFYSEFDDSIRGLCLHLNGDR